MESPDIIEKRKKAPEMLGGWYKRSCRVTQCYVKETQETTHTDLGQKVTELTRLYRAWSPTAASQVLRQVALSWQASRLSGIPRRSWTYNPPIVAAISGLVGLPPRTCRTYRVGGARATHPAHRSLCDLTTPLIKAWPVSLRTSSFERIPRHLVRRLRKIIKEVFGLSLCEVEQKLWQ